MEVTLEQLALSAETSSQAAVKACTTSSSSSESEPEEEALAPTGEQVGADAMLGTLQRGLHSISSHAKEYMDTCKTDENRKNMQNRLETSMLGLLKSEQVVKELPLLVTQVVDKFVDDMDAEEESAEVALEPLSCFKPLLQLNEVRMGAMSQQICELFDKKVKEFEDSLTEDKLKKLPSFTALEEQVAASIKEAAANDVALVAGGGDAPEMDPQNMDEVKFYDPDELSDDELMLPTIDPISKEPMMNPVRNKYCNHVFEEQSVLTYMLSKADPKCPLDYCRNERPFKKEDFVKVPKLTEQVRRKNMKVREGLRPQHIPAKKRNQ